MARGHGHKGSTGHQGWDKGSRAGHGRIRHVVLRHKGTSTWARRAGHGVVSGATGSCGGSMARRGFAAAEGNKWYQHGPGKTHAARFSPKAVADLERPMRKHSRQGMNPSRRVSWDDKTLEIPDQDLV